MNYKSTLVLLILLVIVASVFMWARNRPAPQAEPSGDQATGQLVLDDPQVTVDNIQTIRITRESESPVVLERSDDRWQQTQPVRFALETGAIDQLVERLADLTWHDRATPGEDGAPSLAEMQLDPAQISLTFEVSGTDDTTTTKRSLRLGRQLSGRMYVQRNQDPTVFIAGGELGSYLAEHSVRDWRRRTLPTIDAQRLGQLKIDGPDGPITVERDDHQWRFVGHHDGRVSQDAIANWTAAFSGVHIREFAADNPSDLGTYGLDHPRATLTLRWDQPQTDEGGVSNAIQRGTLYIGRPATMDQGTYYAAWTRADTPPEVVFVVGADDIQSLLTDPEQLRQTKLLPAAQTNLTRLRTQNSAGQIDIARKSGTWVFADPTVGYPVDEDAARTWVDAIAGAQAAGFVPIDALHAKPTATLEAWSVDQQQPAKITVFEIRPGMLDNINEPAEPVSQYAGVLDEEQTGYVLSQQTVAALMAPAVALRERTLLDIDPQQLTAVSVQTPDGATYDFQREPAQAATQTRPGDHSWLLSGEASFETTALEKLVEAILPLDVLSWTPADASISEVAAVHMQLDDGTRYSLVVDTTDGSAILQTPQRSVQGFVVPEAVRQALDAEFRDRTALRFGVGQIGSVTITDGKERVTVRRGANERFATQAADAVVSQDAAASLFDTLAGLRVERYLKSTTEQIEPPTGRQLQIELTDGRRFELTLPGTEQDSSVAKVERQLVVLDERALWKLNQPVVIPSDMPLPEK